MGLVHGWCMGGAAGAAGEWHMTWFMGAILPGLVRLDLSIGEVWFGGW